MANNLVISYDLNKPGQNYAEVERHIRGLGKAIKVMETVWFVSSTYTAEQAREHIKKAATDNNDLLIVVDAKNNNYDGWLNKDVIDFLAKHWSF